MAKPVLSFYLYILKKIRTLIFFPLLLFQKTKKKTFLDIFFFLKNIARRSFLFSRYQVLHSGNAESLACKSRKTKTRRRRISNTSYIFSKYSKSVYVQLVHQILLFFIFSFSTDNQLLNNLLL